MIKNAAGLLRLEPAMDDFADDAQPEGHQHRAVLSRCQLLIALETSYRPIGNGVAGRVRQHVERVREKRRWAPSFRGLVQAQRALPFCIPFHGHVRTAARQIMSGPLSPIQYVVNPYTATRRTIPEPTKLLIF